MLEQRLSSGEVMVASGHGHGGSRSIKVESGGPSYRSSVSHR